MRAEVKPTENLERLKENLERHTEHIEKTDNGNLMVELEDPELLSRTPGVDTYTVDGEQKHGLKGRPVEEEAYIKIEDEEDAVKAFLATVEGYDLRILNSGRDWDIRQLKKYNPDIKHLKFDKPKKVLGIEKAVNIKGKQQIEIDLDEEDVELVYREMLT